MYRYGGGPAQSPGLNFRPSEETRVDADHAETDEQKHWGRAGSSALLGVLGAIGTSRFSPARRQAAASGAAPQAFVAPQLVAAAQAHPQQVFHVIPQGTKSERAVVSAVRRESPVRASASVTA